MNKDLRRAYICEYNVESWAFLKYLREKGVFYHMASPEKKDANPYWWGAILDYVKLDEVVKDLISAKSLKISRLEKIAKELREDPNGPIVSCVGSFLELLIGYSLTRMTLDASIPL